MSTTGQSPRLRRAVGTGAALVALGAARIALAQGCAMCGSGLGDGLLGRAFNTSIVFMMAAPYAIVGVIGGWIVYKHRTAARRRATIIDLEPPGRVASHPAPAGPIGGSIP